MVKVRIYSSSILFITTVAFNMLVEYGRFNNWGENLDLILLSVFLISGFFFWRFVLRNMIWKSMLVAVLNYLIIIILAFIIKHILYGIIFDRSITHILNDNVGQFFFLIPLFAYSLSLIFSFALAFFSLKLFPPNSTE